MKKRMNWIVAAFLAIALFLNGIVYAHTDRDDMLQLNQVTASSELIIGETNYIAARVTDGDYDTSWYAEPADSPAYLTIGWEQVSALSKIKIYWGIYDYATRYTITYTEQENPVASDWKEAEMTAVVNTRTRAHYISEISLSANARQIRITCMETNDWSYEIFEILVFGQSGEAGSDPATTEQPTTEIEQKPSDWSVSRTENHAYLPCEWFDREDLLTPAEIREKLTQLEANDIRYLFMDIGCYEVAESSQGVFILRNTIDDTQLALWIKLAHERGMKVSACINASFSDACFALDQDGNAYGSKMKNQIESLAMRLVNDGVLDGGNSYYVDGIHLDLEPFDLAYQQLFLNIVNSVSDLTGASRMLSVFAPAKNGLWSSEWIKRVAAMVDMINPGVYDTNGPAYWGDYSQGVTRTQAEYVRLVRDTCLWYSDAILKSANPSCLLSPTVPVYEDKVNRSDRNLEGFPIVDSTEVRYHCNYNEITGESLETLANNVRGMNQAIADGARVYSAGIFYWPAFIGESPLYQPAKNDRYLFERDQKDWLRDWVQFGGKV